MNISSFSSLFICKFTTCLSLYVLFANAQIGVASTKAYTSQIVSLVLLGLMMAEDRLSMQGRISEVLHGLEDLSEHIKDVLKMDDALKALAQVERK